MLCHYRSLDEVSFRRSGKETMSLIGSVDGGGRICMWVDRTRKRDQLFTALRDPPAIRWPEFSLPDTSSAI